MIAVGKRRSSIARVHIKEGKGQVFINEKALENYDMPNVVALIKEPLLLAGAIAKKVDLYVNVNGGGVISQAQAARTGIGKALIMFFKDEKLKKKLIEYDKHLVVSDVRQREPRKPWGHGKARAKRQKSYR